MMKVLTVYLLKEKGEEIKVGAASICMFVRVCAGVCGCSCMRVCRCVGVCAQHAFVHRFARLCACVCSRGVWLAMQLFRCIPCHNSLLPMTQGLEIRRLTCLALEKHVV